MRIHTRLTREQMNHVLQDSGAPIGYQSITEHGSRTHERAFNVLLTGSGGYNNTGLYGAGDYKGAIWDEWGAFLGALFAMDPYARVGGEKHPVYDGRTDFHYVTAGRFVQFKGGHVPPDSHKRHRWQRERNGGRWCKSCSAEVQV